MNFKNYRDQLIETSKTLILLRGIPGSGKSFTAKQLAPTSQIFSTDDFWGSEYTFNPALLGRAHNWNQQRVEKAMSQGVSPVVVDNTNITQKELNPYIEMAKANGYSIQIKESESPWWKKISSYLNDKQQFKSEIEDAAKFLTNKNQHGVPLEAITRMLNRWIPTKNLQL